MSDRLFATFRDVVEQARSACRSPDSAPAVQHEMMERFLDRLTSPPLHAFVLTNGINPLLRRVFKAMLAGDDREARQLQLGQWPTAEMRALVARIDHGAVFVPSRGEFVELVPDAMTAAETREAGTYLVHQGEDTIRRGKLLIRLAKLRAPTSRRPGRGDTPDA